MTRLPIVDFPRMEEVLLSLGFQAVRQSGARTDLTIRTNYG